MTGRMKQAREAAMDKLEPCPTDTRYGDTRSRLDAEQRHNLELSAMVDGMGPPADHVVDPSNMILVPRESTEARWDGMSPELSAAIERARNHVITPEERFEQRVSFVYGQQKFGPNQRTKDEIRQMLINLDGRPAAPPALCQRTLEAAAKACAAEAHCGCGRSDCVEDNAAKHFAEIILALGKAARNE